MRGIVISDLIVYLCVFFLIVNANFLNAQQLPNDKLSFLESHICNEELDSKENSSYCFYYNNTIFDNKFFVVIQFKAIPNSQKIKELEANGIELIAYISKQSYIASIVTNVKAFVIENIDIDAFYEIPKTSKLSQNVRMLQHKDNGTTNVVFQYPSSISFDLIQKDLTTKGIKIIQIFDDAPLVEIQININDISNLSACPYVLYIDAVLPPFVAENYEAQTAQRVNILNNSFAGGLDLTGEGVWIGVGDGGAVSEHIDFGHRVINGTESTLSSFGAHADHVTGIIAGAGNRNPRHKGIASDCNVITNETSNIIYRTPDYIEDYGMVLTNNSYKTASFNCYSTGNYDYASYFIDNQLSNYPEILHCVAAGNDGNQTCSDYPQGFHTIARSYASAKNVLTIGSINHEGTIAAYSSRGPAKDGRLKPELVAVGTGVVSTGSDNDYFTDSGTSMATPSVTGTLALLYQRYRQLHNGANPKGSLMKAIACNTADDLGNIGPDYAYGFGRINGRRAVEAIENTQYFEETIESSQTKNFEIQVPQGAAKLKVLLYWQDANGFLISSKALVNDLDLSIHTPQNEEILPWVLDITPANTGNAAIRAADHLNNIEQISIDNPTAGTYTINVAGFEVPFGPQTFFISYEILQPSIVLTYPFGGEQLEPNTLEYIHWDAFGIGNENLTLEYSLDNGMNWQIIANDIPSSMHLYAWQTPERQAASVLLRIGNETLSDETMNPFTLAKVPVDLFGITNKPHEIELYWNAVEGAVAYQILTLDTIMKPFAIATTNYYNAVNLKAGKHWFAVQAIMPNGIRSRASKAIWATSDPLFLDIHLSFFVAKKEGGNALLSWNTLSEINNKGFDIQVARSTEELEKGEFETIGYVEGAGTTAESNDYSFTDERIGKNGVFYYRLKQINYDSTYTYSSIEALQFGQEVATTIYPNPVHDVLTIELKKEDNYSLKIFSVTGQLINEISTSNNSTATIDWSHFSNGVYILQIESNEKREQHKIVKW